MLYKRELINSFETIGYSCCIMMGIVYGPKWPYYSCDGIYIGYIGYIGLFGTGICDELKSHLFLVHFSVCFSFKNE